MKTPLLIPALSFALALQAHAESVFTAAFSTAQNTGMIAGGITLTVHEDHASFTSMLFSYVPAANLQAWLAVGRKEIPFDLGAGTAGTWPVQQFLAPGISPPAPQGGIDPGFAIPPTADGTRFTGSLTASNLERLLLARGGTIFLQVHGIVAGTQDPLLSAPLQNVSPIHFAAQCTGRSEVPPNASPYYATGHFTLTGTVLVYTLITQPGFVWTSLGIYGPGNQHSTSAKLVAQLQTSVEVHTVAPGLQTQPGSLTYSGTVTLTDQQMRDLKRGLLYVNFLTSRYPGGEIRGQVLPTLDAKGNKDDTR